MRDPEPGHRHRTGELGDDLVEVVVRRTVVDDHHLVLRAFERLVRERGQALTQEVGAFVGGDENADARD